MLTLSSQRSSGPGVAPQPQTIYCLYVLCSRQRSLRRLTRVDAKPSFAAWGSPEKCLASLSCTGQYGSHAAVGNPVAGVGAEHAARRPPEDGGVAVADGCWALFQHGEAVRSMACEKCDTPSCCDPKRWPGDPGHCSVPAFVHCCGMRCPRCWWLHEQLAELIQRSGKLAGQQSVATRGTCSSF